MTMPSASRLMWIQSTLLLPAPVKRSSAAQIATAIALEPPIPAPAGASESVVSVKPPSGRKNFTISASSGSRNDLVLRRAAKDEKDSERLVSSETSVIRESLDAGVSMVQRAYR